MKRSIVLSCLFVLAVGLVIVLAVAVTWWATGQFFSGRQHIAAMILASALISGSRGSRP